jgi:hypothetical protein
VAWMPIGSRFRFAFWVTSPSELVDSFGTNWDQISMFGVCKWLKTWWPGTESVPLRLLIPCNLLLFRLPRSSRCARSAMFWHKSGTDWWREFSPDAENDFVHSDCCEGNDWQGTLIPNSAPTEP